MASAITRILRLLGLAMACPVSVARAQCPVQQISPWPDYPDSGFGLYAAIEGDTAAVFQFGYPFGQPPAMTYIYERQQNVWRFRQSLLGSWSVFENESGPLALYRDWLAVGVETYDPSGTNSHGGVHLYQRTANGWEFKQLLTDNTLFMFAGMGCSLSFAEDRLAVGTYSGRTAYVYELNPQAPNVWSLMAKLPSPTGLINAFGRSVALDRTTLVVGSPGPSPGDQGAAYVFELIQGTWELETFAEISYTRITKKDRIGAGKTSAGRSGGEQT